MSGLTEQLREVADLLDAASIRWALIGGLAVVVHQYIRSTQDVDLLVDANDAGRVEQVVTGLGYVRVHRSDDAGNYQRGEQRLDFLYASRPIARRLLEAATLRNTAFFGPVRVIGVEGLIGFKLQAVTNDPRRLQDLVDIQALLRANREKLNMAEVREYFALFGREALLDELLH